jgi:hypothetical protein
MPYTHGWLAFEVLRRSTNQQLTAIEYERRLFHPSPEILDLEKKIPGVRGAYQDLKHIRCDIFRGAVLVEPQLPKEWFNVRRCSGNKEK